MYLLWVIYNPIEFHVYLLWVIYNPIEFHVYLLWVIYNPYNIEENIYRVILKCVIKLL